ncbi:MAG: D-glycero-beta-D-manno-heptose-7-phosphate kinase, partial [Desulfovibrio sp.]|nr:D-glycero-beta-D-manno-heptose-7-phosphate kinase [Desulfovibrio sp.]
LITLGAQGMALFEGPEKARLIPTFARKVFDVTGAGDTVIATLALALAAGADLLSAAVLANHAAGIVVAQVGAATASVEALREAINKNPHMDIEDLPGLA